MNIAHIVGDGKKKICDVNQSNWKFLFKVYIADAYSEPCQTSKMEYFAKIVNS